MISGRYRSDDLCKHWSPTNKQGHCVAPPCQGAGVVGDLEHILVECPALNDTRDRLKQLWLERSRQSPAFYQMIRKVLASPPSLQVQFILDPTVFDGTAMLTEIYGYPFLSHVHYLTRTYAYYLHRQRLIVLERWPGDFGRKKKVPNYNNPSNNSSFSGLPIIPINSVLDRYPVSRCTTVSTTTTPSTIITMTGATTHNTEVTLGSSSVWAQPVSPAQSAQHSLMRPSLAPTAVHFVVTDTASCHNSTLEANSYSGTATGSCSRPVMSVSGSYSSVISQSKPS